MLSIQYLRENADKAKENCDFRGFPDGKQLVDDALELDVEYRGLLKQEEELRHKRNVLSKKISETKKQGGDASQFLSEAKALPVFIKELQVRKDALWKKIGDVLVQIPNIVAPEVPQGASENDNVEIETFGEKREFDFEVKNHAEIAEQLGIADFGSAARVSGSGFFYLKGDLALLNQALIRYSLDFLIKKGYTFCEPPLLVRPTIIASVYSKVDIAQQVYTIADDDLALIATSEHPLVGMFVEQRVDARKLPVRLAGYSQCFRKEVGSHGLDERGLFRTHQFNKVEQVVLCRPGDSARFFDEILRNSIELFVSLGLPGRLLEICTGDLGFMKNRSVDVELWSPRKQSYIEVCSCSNLTDNQALLLDIRGSEHNSTFHVHTLNNTAIATSRAMVAILENYQTAQGDVVVPEVLRPYMFNKEKLEKLPELM